MLHCTWHWCGKVTIMQRTDKRHLIGLTTALLLLLLQGCGSGDSSHNTPKVASPLIGYYVDMPVENISYRCGQFKGKTDQKGTFLFEKGKACQLYVGSLPLRKISASILDKNKVTIFESNADIAALLQSFDIQHMYGSHIQISSKVIEALDALEITSLPQDDKERKSLIETINHYYNENLFDYVSESEAIVHLKQSLANYSNRSLLHLTEPKANWINSNLLHIPGVQNMMVDWVNTTHIYTSEQEPQKPIETKDYTLIAWSELGMHCMDGTVLCILFASPLQYPKSTTLSQWCLPSYCQQRCRHYL